MQKIVIVILFLTFFTHSIELTELEIIDELYTGNILTEKESSQYSFIGARVEEDTIIVAAQKRNPYSLSGYNCVKCGVHTKKDKCCFYTDYIAGKQHLTLFRLHEPDAKAFALLLLYVSTTAKRSDQVTKRFPKLSPEAESCN
jgi:hypothetical protein